MHLKSYFKKMNKNGLTATALLLIASGCCHAQTNIVPREKDMLIQALSSSESCAFSECQKAAEEYCGARGKSFVMLKHKTSYQGMDKTAAGIIGAAGVFADKPISTASGNDYKVVMTFRCR